MKAGASAIRLMMTTDAVGGVWIYATSLARALAAAGYEVLLVTMGPRPTAAQKQALQNYRGLSLIETDLQLEWQDPGGSDMCRADALLGGIADRFGPDLVHLNGFREAMFDWPVPTVLVSHSCVNSWAEACGEADAFTDDAWNAYTLSVRAGLQNVKAWVAPTKAFRDQMRAQYRLSRDGHVIWNGVDAGDGRCTGKELFVLGAGRLWDKAKNLSTLASAAAAVDVPVRIAGPSSLHEAAVANGAENCTFLGEVPHATLLAEMESASIFVSPSLYEPFGLAVLEAARAGCALLLSDLPGFRELWDGAALFFDPRDLDQLSAGLRALCRDQVQRERLQHAAAARALKYTLSRTVQSYRNLYNSLLTGAGNSLLPAGYGEAMA